jgi:hypothetical protein
VLKQLPIISLFLLLSACKPVSEQNSVSNTSVLVSQCIESQSLCEINTELGSFSIKFSQQQLSDKVITELPFFIELSQLKKNSEQITDQRSKPSTNKSITKVSAYLEGKDMFMGKVPVFFDQGANESTYVAQSLLASCSEDQMVWRLWVTVEIVEKTQTFFVDFTSQRL